MSEVEKTYQSSEPVYVVDEDKLSYRKVNRECPQCGNNDAFYWASQISGEHAGVTQERMLAHFKCTKCLFMWAESN